MNDITKLFNKFSGREVTPFNDADPTVTEMRKLAEDNGFSLRVWHLNTLDTGSMDGRTDRINAYVGKGNDGKWRVTNNFDIG